MPVSWSDPAACSPSFSVDPRPGSLWDGMDPKIMFTAGQAESERGKIPA